MGFMEDHPELFVSTPTVEEMEAESAKMAPERGTVSDLIHAGWRGMGQAAGLTGAAMQQAGMDKAGQALRDVGTSIDESQYAKPDPNEYYGKQGMLKNAAMMGVEMVPNMLAPAAAGIVGTAVGTPLVGVGAALATRGAIFGGGTYKQSLETIQKERPDLPLEEQESYAFKQAAYELGPELLTDAAAMLSGGWLAGGKPLVKAGVKNLIDSGIYNTEQVLKAALKGKGPKEIATVFGLNLAGEGGTEVFTELAQRANDKEYGVEHEDIDLMTLAIAAMLPGSVMTTVGAAGGRMKIQQVKKNIEKGLASEDINTRLGTVNAFADQLETVDPEYAAKFRKDITARAVEGPVSLETEIGPDAEAQRLAEAETDANEIINNPEEILKENDIPVETNLRTTDRSAELAATEAAKAKIEADRLAKYGPQATPEEVTAGIAKEEAQRLQLEKEKANKIAQETVDDYMKVADNDIFTKSSWYKDSLAAVGENADGTPVANLSVPLYDAVIQDNARSQAIKEGMQRVLVDSNKLAEITNLDEREVLQNRIEKTQKQIIKEVQAATPQLSKRDQKVLKQAGDFKYDGKDFEGKHLISKDGVQFKVNNLAIDEIQRAADKTPLARPAEPVVPSPETPRVTKVKPEAKPKVKEAPKAQEEAPTTAYEEQLKVVDSIGEQLDTAMAELDNAENSDEEYEAKIKVKELQTVMKGAEDQLRSLKAPKVEVAEEVGTAKTKDANQRNIDIAEDKPLDPEKLQLIADAKADGSNKFIRQLAREHEGDAASFAKMLEGPVIAQDKGVGAGQRTITYLDGTTIEYTDSPSKATRYRLTKDGMVKRGKSIKELQAAIENDTIHKLDNYAEKVVTKKNEKARKKLSKEQKAEVQAFIDSNTTVDVFDRSPLELTEKISALGLALNDLAIEGKLKRPDGEWDLDAIDKAAKRVLDAEQKTAVKGKVTLNEQQSSEDTQKMLDESGDLRGEGKGEVAPVKVYTEEEKKALMAKRKPTIIRRKKVDVKDIVDGKDMALSETTKSRMREIGDRLSDEAYDKIYEDYVPVDDPDPLGTLQNFDKEHPEINTQELADIRTILVAEVEGFNTAGVKQMFESKYQTAEQLLEDAMKFGDDETRVLSKLILGSKKIRAKLANIPVTMELDGGGSYFDRGTGTVNISPNTVSNYAIWLHEVVHSVTSRELLANKETKAEITKMMKLLEDNLEGYVDPGLLELVKQHRNDARGFQDAAKDFTITEGRLSNPAQMNLVYAVVNEREFLAQAFNSPAVKNVMKTIRYKETGGSFFGTMLNKFMELVRTVLKMPKEFVSLLEATYETTLRVAEAPVGNRIPTSMYDYALTKEQREQTPDSAAREVLKNKKAHSWSDYLGRRMKPHMREFSKLVEPIQDMIGRHSKAIAAKLGMAEAQMQLTGKKWAKKADPFLRWYSSLSKEEKVSVDFGLMNTDKGTWARMPKDVQTNLKELLADMRKDAEYVGLIPEDMKQNEYYFPRRANDMAGLTSYLLKDTSVNGPIGVALKEKADSLGIPVDSLDDATRTQVVADMMASGEVRQLARPGSTKKRSIYKITPDIYEYYMSSSDALTAHIYEMNEKVGIRKFAGGSIRKAKLAKLTKLTKEIEGMKDGAEKRSKLLEWDSLNNELTNLETDLDEGIAALIQKEMSNSSPEAQTAVMDALSARMRQKGASGFVDGLRNVGYMATMGNFLSAITQLGDIPIIFHRYGGITSVDNWKSVADAFKNVYKVAKGEITGKPGNSGAMVDDMDFTNALREFSSSKVTAKALETVFKYSGLKYSDLVGKEASMQASFKYYGKKENAAKFMEKYEPFFGDRTESVLKQIQAGNRTSDDVKSFLLAELAEFQPVTLSQQSEYYLKGGNMRAFYSLKTFTLRTTAAAIREANTKIQKGDYKGGAYQFAAIIAVYAVAGAGADELKNLIKGRDVDFSDNVVDKVIGMFFLSKYAASEGLQKDKLATSFVNSMLPPVRYMDNFFADVTAAVGLSNKDFKFKTLNMLPIVGAPWYQRTEAGKATIANSMRMDLMDSIRANIEDGKNPRAGIGDKILKYNSSVSRDKRITDKTIKRVKKNKK